jgi:hypothetical protein
MPSRAPRRPTSGWRPILVLLLVLLLLGFLLRSQGCHYNAHFSNRISCE